ncbi:hypothetical protein CVIRNUC_003670 [Coccomyxa viridis]|uniref:Uncharacterized protein n=1 Tax=Coccomyxa viridis TaxID=1274662 RepID=A0AAV1I2A1_9CHLO|nr:hypothetical protein CVIRNUC_003670 [Coccomyxa viridis]
MGVDDWIERNRLTIGLSESYRRVDHVAASLMRSQCQLNALQQTVVDIQSANAESARQHAESARQHTEVARQHARTATTVTELSGAGSDELHIDGGSSDAVVVWSRADAFGGAETGWQR